MNNTLIELELKDDKFIFWLCLATSILAIFSLSATSTARVLLVLISL
jgi:hypothetical protein